MRAGRACGNCSWCCRCRDELAECVACCSAAPLPCADPREQAGLYWGYTTRIVPSLAALLDPAQCPFEGGYDLTVGTSGALAAGSARGYVPVCLLCCVCHGWDACSSASLLLRMPLAPPHPPAGCISPALQSAASRRRRVSCGWRPPATCWLCLVAHRCAAAALLAGRTCGIGASWGTVAGFFAVGYAGRRHQTTCSVAAPTAASLRSRPAGFGACAAAGWCGRPAQQPCRAV